MATYTPIPHWLQMPLIEACIWYGAVARVQAEDEANARGAR
jgi:hypothetical protein